jgi:protein required for attachment to host cells
MQGSRMAAAREAGVTRSTWGLAIDGARARIVRDLETNLHGLPIPEELGLEVHPRKLGDIMSDRPGRSDATVGGARSEMDYASDPEREDDRAFCEEVLWLLGSHHRRGDFDRLVVAAEPRMLGLLRDRRSREIAAATVAEASKDYLHLAPAELRARLREIVPSRIA